MRVVKIFQLPTRAQPFKPGPLNLALNLKKLYVYGRLLRDRIASSDGGTEGISRSPSARQWEASKDD